MSLADDVRAPIRHADRFFIGGQWVQPSSGAMIKVTDSGTEELFFSVAEAQAADISRAVEAAREAFDNGPWTQLTHAERAGYLRAIGAELGKRGEEAAEAAGCHRGWLFGRERRATGLTARRTRLPPAPHPAHRPHRPRAARRTQPRRCDSDVVPRTCRVITSGPQSASLPGQIIACSSPGALELPIPARN